MAPSFPQIIIEVDAECKKAVKMVEYRMIQDRELPVSVRDKMN